MKHHTFFLTCETEFVLILAVLENSVSLMGRDRSHAMLKMTSEFLISGSGATYAPNGKRRMTLGEGRYLI